MKTWHEYALAYALVIVLFAFGLYGGYVLAQQQVAPTTPAVEAAPPQAPAPSGNGPTLTPFERGQLITQCYQIPAAVSVYVTHVDYCLKDVAKLP